MLLVRSGVVRIIKKTSSHPWKSTWTPPRVRTTTESEVFSQCCRGFRESSGLHDFEHTRDRRRTFLTSPVVSVPAHLDHPHLLPITHLLWLFQSANPSYILISSAGFIHIRLSLFCLVLFAPVGVTCWHFLSWTSPHVLPVSLSFICSENATLTAILHSCLCSPLDLMRGSPGFRGQNNLFLTFSLFGGPVE